MREWVGRGIAALSKEGVALGTGILAANTEGVNLGEAPGEGVCVLKANDNTVYGTISINYDESY